MNSSRSGRTAIFDLPVCLNVHRVTGYGLLRGTKIAETALRAIAAFRELSQPTAAPRISTHTRNGAQKFPDSYFAKGEELTSVCTG